ncbi:MAG: methyltransferase domain-containing protein [Streptosporangiaceae bacterium]
MSSTAGSARPASDQASAAERQQADAQRAVRRARQTADAVRLAVAAQAYGQGLVREMFAQPVHDYVVGCIGRPVRLLRAGCLTSLDELGLDMLRVSGFEIGVTTIDEDRPEFACLTDEITLGDLRTVPLPPRSVDIVHCSLLLDRISHVELVLDRFVAALRPGGLLLLRIRDPDCAAAVLDRHLPERARRALWAERYPGLPGPFPAVYSPEASDRGIQAYAHLRGLTIAHRETGTTWPGRHDRAGRGDRRLRTGRLACRLIRRLTRGRATDAYDEVSYVIRRPEDRFARVL